MPSCELLIVGASGGTNVGESILEGAKSLGIHSQLLDTTEASSGPRLWRSFAWHVLDHRPARLGSFSKRVVEECKRLRPRKLLAVGVGALNQQALQAARQVGITTMVFLTDDPWNPGHRSRWAMRAIPEYEHVFSPRRANLEDLRRLRCRNVHYLPFGYDPRHCRPETPDPSLSSDILFVGGADGDRVPLIDNLVTGGLRPTLYGSYWERFRETRDYTQGQASPEVIRRATASTKIALCLVRRANRDGHVMRSLEIPAVGACMLVEDTDEHRELFGAEGEAVVYFSSKQEMCERASWLLQRDEERARLSRSAHQLITSRKHTYADRLAAMLDVAR